nr:MAG TPA: hypothetical protein [Caudoviricetes sp.]
MAYIVGSGSDMYIRIIDAPPLLPAGGGCGNILSDNKPLLLW